MITNQDSSGGIIYLPLPPATTTASQILFSPADLAKTRRAVKRKLGFQIPPSTSDKEIE